MVALTCSIPNMLVVHSARINSAIRFFTRRKAKVLYLKCMNTEKKKTKTSTTNIVASSSINRLTTKTIEVSPENTSTFVTSEENPLHRYSSSTSSPLKSANSLQYESGFLGAVPDKRKWLRDESNDIEECGVLSVIDYLTNILSSKQVYDVAIETPLQYASKLSERIGANIWLKREDLQPVISLLLE